MGFGCPICSEKLDRLPAEAQARATSNGKELNISATPCGHIFHAYCIQKWLSGHLASSKQCPCCRKDVPKLRCLSLFPTTYDESILDDSLSQSTEIVAPCNHGEIITSLKNQVTRLESEAKEKDQLYNLLSTDFDTMLEKFRREKLTSDTWMMRAKEYESYKDLANELEKRTEIVEAQLKTYKLVESMIKGVEVSVNEDLHSFPPTEQSIRSLLEMKSVMSKELKNSNNKFSELKSNYEILRSEKMKLKSQFDKQNKEYKELKHVYEISRVNGRIRSASPVAGTSHGMNLSATPTEFRNKRRFQESLPSSTETKYCGDMNVDSNVDIFPSNFKIKKSKAAKQIKLHPKDKDESCSKSNVKTVTSKTKASSKFAIPISPIAKATGTPIPTSHKLNATVDISSDSSFDGDDNDDLRIRGSVPGAPLPISANRMRNLQRKSERPVLGVSSKTKKFNFK